MDNTSYLRKLTEAEKQQVGDSLSVKVIVKNGCDDYDRIGRVTLIYAHKNTNYNDASAQGIELLRIMTPFNYRTRQPDNIPYAADISQLVGLFKNSSIDIWLKVDIFGTTGAGQKETIGCGGSLLTYIASVSFISNEQKNNSQLKVYPLLNYYPLNGEDTSDGYNAKAAYFTLARSSKSAKLYIISSGHGAAEGGEEYNWREHIVFLDGKAVKRLDVKQNCVPFEVYNTRFNGIYNRGGISKERRSWCPGAPVPIHIVDLGALNEGKHTIKIEIPDAKLLKTQSTYYLSDYVVVE